MTDRLEQLITALGYDAEIFLHNDEKFALLLDAAGALSRIKKAISTSRPEKSRDIFICGVSSEKDETGFPSNITVCIEFGSDVIANYTKTKVGGHG